MRKTAPKGRKKYAVGGQTTAPNSPLTNRPLTGNRLPEGKTGPMEHFNKMRERDLEMLQNRMARPQIQQNADRLAKLQSIQSFMKANPMAAYSDARSAYNASMGRGLRGPAQAAPQQTTAMKKGGAVKKVAAKKPLAKKGMGRAKGRA